MALCLSGLQNNAYPANERQSPVRNFCRMALRLSGLQNNAYLTNEEGLPW